MDYFRYLNNAYVVEDVPLAKIAELVGTPCYVYSRATIERNWHVFDSAFGQYPHHICYAVKANSNLAVLDLLVRLGSHFDIVSVGELERVIRAGGSASNVIFSGVGKGESEIKRAIELGIGCINLESESELERVARIAVELGKKVPIGIRINPEVDAKTHPYITTGLRDNKFGVEINKAAEMFRRAADIESIIIKGIACHIGSQMLEIQPFLDAIKKVVDFLEDLLTDGVQIDHLDIGGGFGIRYKNENPPLPADYVNVVVDVMESRRQRLPVMIEPGRSIVGNAGVLITKVEYLKHNDQRDFAVVDAGMNDLMRPALYGSYHEILPARLGSESADYNYSVVGPICESADFLGHERNLALAETDLLVIQSAGAYGFVMSSNYNSKPRPPEVIVDQDQFYVVRRRETLNQLMEGECLFPR